jgi:hypothetical protein
MTSNRRAVHAGWILAALVVVGCGGGGSGRFVALNALTQTPIDDCLGCVVSVAQVPTAYTDLSSGGYFDMSLDMLSEELRFLSESQQFMVFKVRTPDGSATYESRRYPVDSLRAWIKAPDRDSIPIPLTRAIDDAPGWQNERQEIIQQEGPVRDG